jgi:geranylgeranyl diphosphate synthase type II
MATIKDTLADYGRTVETYLSGCLRDRGVPDRLLEAMEYSLLAGGKRVRPVLCLVWAEMLGLERDRAVPAAAALELIHTYSLVHDDLPAMDDDDLRRGRPSNHKVFGEAMAILAGDGLLTEAFGLMLAPALDGSLPPALVARAASAVAGAAGAGGMVGGQAVDMLLTGKTGVGLDELRRMHAMKTGALIEAACVSGAILGLAAAGDERMVESASAYGRAIGVAFQIADDILDVVGKVEDIGKPVGSDQSQGKNTYPSLVGLDRSREMALECVDLAHRSLDGFAGPQASFLVELARYIVDRVS